VIDFGAEKGERVSKGRARDQGRQGGETTIGIGGKAKLYGGLGYVKAIGVGLLPWAPRVLSWLRNFKLSKGKLRSGIERCLVM
jgi:hypothetical protein